MAATTEMPAGLRRARRSAAGARASLAGAGITLIVAGVDRPTHMIAAIAGFAIIFATALVQLLIPQANWLKLEESLAPVAALLLAGVGGERVSAIWLLWLTAVACGVLARGGRQFWVGRALLLIALALPIASEHRVTLLYGCQCLAAIVLLLVCGRVTQELRAMLDRARYDADHDGLTGALSRTAFRDNLDRVAARPGGGEGEAVLVLDLDNFGSINKSAGHAAGDAVLRSVVERVRAVVGPESHVGRLGGDEFGVIVRAPDLEALGGRLLAEIADASPRRGGLSASVGMALIPRDGRDADSLLRAGDVALRVAKRGGRSGVSLYAGDPIIARGAGGAEDALERLIAGEGLEMAVQPIVSITEGTIHAYEALARFRLGASASPLHWFALADELAARDRLELACLRAALGLLDDLPDGTRLSVNLSGPLLVDERVAEMLAARRDLPRLILEVTENSLLSDTADLNARIAELVVAGVDFAVDDMGAGYSGLGQITALHPRYLKLDRSLISGIDGDDDRAALVAAMLGYVRQVGGHLVAEGVETLAELETLRGLGVELIQGYLLGRPAAPWPGLAALPVS